VELDDNAKELLDCFSITAEEAKTNFEDIKKIVVNGKNVAEMAKEIIVQTADPRLYQYRVFSALYLILSSGGKAHVQETGYTKTDN
jgi:hypothetical protein